MDMNRKIFVICLCCFIFNLKYVFVSFFNFIFYFLNLKDKVLKILKGIRCML